MTEHTLTPKIIQCLRNDWANYSPLLSSYTDMASGRTLYETDICVITLKLGVDQGSIDQVDYTKVRSYGL